MKNQLLHEVTITAIIKKDGKYLITRRSENKNRFPGMWTVPGGWLETDDYTTLEKDTEHHWYNVMEKVLRREVKEEVDLEITNIDYVTSLAIVFDDGAPSMIISMLADWESGEVKLQEEETDEFAWVTAAEVENYDLIDGIYDEIVMADNKQTSGKSDWSRANK